MDKQTDFEWWVETVGGATLGFVAMGGFVFLLAFGWVIIADLIRLILEVLR